MSIDSSYYLGPIVVQQLSPINNTNALEDFHFTEKTTNSLGETEFSYVPKQTDKDIAAYYIGNLVEYNIKREDGSTFEVYVLISGAFVTVLNVD